MKHVFSCITVFVLLLSFSFSLPHQARALEETNPCMTQGVAQIGCLEPIFASVVTAIASFVGIVLLVMLIMGGFKYLTSGGDAKKVEQARGTLTAAFLGLLCIIGAYIILRLLGAFTGLDLTTFRIVFFPN